MSIGLALEYMGFDPLLFDVRRGVIERWDESLGPQPSLAEITANVQPAIEAAIVADINNEAQELIYSRYPQWKQANLTARAVELNDIRANNVFLTEAEETERQAILSVWGWISAVRAASNTMTSDPMTYADPGSRTWPA